MVENSYGIDTLAEIQALADQLEDAQAEIAKAEKALEIAQNKEKLISEDLIPQLLEERGINPDNLRVTTKSGFTLEMKEFLSASVAQSRMPAFIAWLEANGHGGMVKREIIVAFNQDQEAAASELREKLRKEYPGVKSSGKVHPMTLKSWVKGRLDEGEDVPESVKWSIFKVAKLK